MLTAVIVKTVDWSIRHAWTVIAVCAALVLLSAVYAGRHFAINTDVSGLISTDAPWARRQQAIDDAFPQRNDATLVVVRAGAPEFAAQAARELAAALQRQPGAFFSVDLADGSEFFARNGLLFLPLADVAEITGRLGDARPLLNALARDPSLRGLANLLAVTMAAPLQTGQIKLADMARLMDESADAIDAALAQRPAALSWRALLDAGATRARSLLRVRPKLDYSALEPGAASARAIRATAAQLRLAERYGASVSLTGAIPLADEEFASVQQGAALSGAVTFALVLAILWFALRSAKLVLAVFLCLAGGLVVTAALGLMMVGALNIISVAFAVLFVGIGVDFGIQFGVRFREMRHAATDPRAALLLATRSIALPLTLAATATAAGFLAFLPTAYRGVSELGQIAGVGILFVAFPSCITLLPALIAKLRPAERAGAPGYRWLAPVEHAFQAHRGLLLSASVALILLGTPLLRHLEFDFDPLHLKNPSSESMATLLSLADMPQTGMNNIQVLAPSLGEALRLGRRIALLPRVGAVTSLASFVPEAQPEKLRHIAQAADALLPVLRQAPAPGASDAQRVAALRLAARATRNAALDHEGPGAAQARRLAASLSALAAADAGARERAETAIALPLRLSLSKLEAALHAQPISIATLPPELARDWITPDGHALLEVSPKTNPRQGAGDQAALSDFVAAVQRVAPQATGGPVATQATAHIVVHAFIQAAALALFAITALLLVALRRMADVLYTVVPLLVSALVTLELSVLFGIPLNFANIIALPLLLGIGVAFKIYYVMAWRAGQGELLGSGLTQAILLSAATTGTAFGSLWLSQHPGTASMGRLLVLALACTLIGAVFFQPILMGTPRQARKAEPSNET